MKKSEYKPNYAASPMETIKELAVIQIFGKEMYREMEKQISEDHARLLEAMFHIPRKFFITLQKNYEKVYQTNKM